MVDSTEPLSICNEPLLAFIFELHLFSWVEQKRLEKQKKKKKPESVSHTVVSDSLQPHRMYLTRLLCPWDSWQENWSGLPFPSSEDLPDPGIEPGSPALQADSGKCY